MSAVFFSKIAFADQNEFFVSSQNSKKSRAPQSEEHGKALLQTHIFPLLIGSVLPRVISFLWNCPQGLCIRQSQNRWDIIRGVLFQKTEPETRQAEHQPRRSTHAIHRYESPSASNARALAARRSPPIDRTDHPSALWRRNEGFPYVRNRHDTGIGCFQIPL